MSRLPFNLLEKPKLRMLLELSRENSCKLYLVGGYLRDLLIALNRSDREQKEPPACGDFDFMVLPFGKALSFARIFADKIGGNFVLLDKENETARVIDSDGICFDFAGAVGNELDSDIKRRDFTVNALAVDLENPQELIDLVCATDDIEKGYIRAISKQAFCDDPLRLLRAFRFAAVLGFEIEKETASYIQEHSEKISEVAGERINHELMILLGSAQSAPQVKAMALSGLLEQIFSELKKTREVTKNDFHHLGLFDHSIETLVQVERTYEQMPDWVKTRSKAELAAGASRYAACKLAGLLHDIGKPATWVITDTGKHTFIGHDKLGAEMCEPLAERLKWSNAVERFIEKLVRWHLRPGQLFNQGDPTDRALYRFYKTIGAELPELVILAMADFRSTCGPGLQEGRQQAESKLLELLDGYCVFVEGTKKESRFLDGSQLMAILGIGPGPLIGRILDEIQEAQHLGEVRNSNEAEAFARKLYQEKYCR